MQLPLRFWVHLGLWTLFFVITINNFIDILPVFGIEKSIFQIFIYSAIYVSLLSILPFLNTKYFIPKMYRFDFVFKYWISYIGLFVGFLLVFLVLDFLFLYPKLPVWFGSFRHFISRSPYLLIFSLVTYLFQIWDEQQQQKKQLEEILDNLKTEDIAKESMKKIDLQLKRNGLIFNLELHEILYIEGMKQYVIYHTLQGKFYINDTLQNQEEKLTHFNFCRIHRSYIVNLKKVNAKNSKTIRIDTFDLPIGRSYSEQLTDKFLTDKLA